jgi:hypothetical protein
VSLDSLVGAVRGELSRRELAAVVRAQHPKLAPTRSPRPPERA